MANRIMMNVVKAMKNINVTGENEREKFKEMIERMRYARYDVEFKEWEQLDHCNAWISDRTLISYSTAVAYFDGINIYEFGPYSRTTSKQVTKWANEYHPGADIIRLTGDIEKMAEDAHTSLYPVIW